jgi:hypothetical protein
MHCGNITRHCGKTNNTTGRPQVHCGYTTDAHGKTIDVVWDEYWFIVGNHICIVARLLVHCGRCKWKYINSISHATLHKMAVSKYLRTVQLLLCKFIVIIIKYLSSVLDKV